MKNYVRPGSKEDGEPYGLELMNDIIALIPVDRAAVERKMPVVWRMPHRPLYKQLRKKSERRVLRSDLSIKPFAAPDPEDKTPPSTDWTPVPGKPGLSWRHSAEAFPAELGTQGPLYYDIRVPAR
jgi:hypothetical protein